MDSSLYTKRTIIKHSICSKYLNEDRQVRVYLPPGYNELLSYPIVYAQDGQDVFMYGRIATIANYLILEKNMEPIIIVGVDVDKQKRTSEYATDGNQNSAYKNFFTKELIPFIEGIYPIKGSTIQRLLIGDSLGATVALDLALENKELFQHVLSLSGAFFTPTEKQIMNHVDLEWLHLWMIVGLQETEVDTERGIFDFLQVNRTTQRLLTEKKAKLYYNEKNGQHLWGFWQQELPDALLYFFQENV
ncbi:alpha/beta hydrolase [Caldalkalibacillus mannanilyticus]|uniref:alpha/beta hydrolase n=1 Tax=Caldalkalibacillus mannanilyticus TaxID=1418 RepID=UPI000469ED95|nr:alpha/beta hydrolase-fold protein [Caldalkalibacillus mannanilyticus]